MLTQSDRRQAPLCVLVVDDDRALGEIIQTRLTAFGYNALLAHSIQTAFEIAGSQHLDGAILDVHVAGVVSFGFAESLVSQGVPYIFMSGGYLEELPDPHHGVVLIRKPFRALELMRYVSDMTGH